MMEYSRREALSKFLSPAKRVARSVQEPVETWIPVGSIANFPFGTNTGVNEGEQRIVSGSYGLQALDTTGRRQSRAVVRPLRLAGDGTLWLNPGGEWPPDSCLNIMTGEQIQLTEGE